MDCKTASDLMVDYMDNMMAEGQLDALQEHIEACGDCQEEWKHTLEMKNLLEDMEWEEPSEDFSLRVMNSIDHRLYQGPSTRTRGLRPVLWSLFLYILVLLLFQHRKAIVSTDGALIYLDQIITLGSKIEQLFWLLLRMLIYPRRILLALLRDLGSISLKGMFIYMVGLLNLTVLLVVIQITLFKMLNVKGMVEED